MSSVAELLTLASLFPFLAVLSDPNKALRLRFVAKLYQLFGVGSTHNLLVILTFLVAVAALTAAAIRTANLYYTGRLAALIGNDLSVDAYERTLCQPYEVHTARNSSEIITKISYAGLLVAGVLQPLLAAITSAVLTISIVIGLLSYEPILACALAVILGVTYGLISRFSKRRLRQVSSRSASIQESLLKTQQESLGGIRDVILEDSQPVYVDIFRKLDRPYRLLNAEAVFVAQMPRFLLEGIGIAAIATSAMILASLRGFASALPSIGVLILAVQRLLPAIQMIYASTTTIRSYRAILSGTLMLLEQRKPINPEPEDKLSLSFLKTIRFDDVHFSYRDSKEIICGLSFEIRKGECIGFVGTTGSGKSTTADLLMGLLSPTTGRILVDATPLQQENPASDRRAEWRKIIAHVPQSIFLTDNSIAANIAFGIDSDRIDWPRLKQAAMQAQIDAFISGLPAGYETYVGERGVRLSGGQRQRIGIARALYKQAEVLVLDEATSALDSNTEHAFIKVLECIRRDLTVIMIAHRLTTLRYCDQILEIEAGKIKAQGSFAELTSLSSSFRSMIKAAGRNPSES
ncbi:ABC transporter ATP-binding protein [Microcystis elabens FACHB-917]|nr:ABC transporter ATP-binding protein [Microcystis elabens FACHB-917]